MLPYKSLTEPFQQQSYLKNWEAVEKKVSAKGFTWATLYENYEDNQYMSDSLLLVPRGMAYEIENASRAVHDIYTKAFERICKDPSTLHQLGFPVMLWDLFLKPSKTKFSYFVRYDFIASAEGLKVIEANTDTPVGIVEASIAQEVLCAEHHSQNPNSQLGKRIRDAWYQVIKDYYIRSTDTLFFTCADWHTEDKQTVEYLLSLYPQKAKYVPLEHIVVEKSGVKTPDGEKIDFLYRLYPLEYFLEEKSGTGEAIGEQFLVHIMEDTLKVINPPSALLMQSKAILALITSKKEEWFTRSEQNAIEKYFLPTYHSLDQLQDSYVRKPVLGREGGGIQMVVNGTVLEEDNEYYQNQKTVYQPYFPMPDQTIDTWDGPYTGKLLIGSHVIGGEPSGLFFRVGGLITGDLSMFVPYTTI
ncbi:glutathionylspermidine synthase family protein [Anaerobacillus sp. CMMVII]|uniref:glutathionylspermidine synthase family protein n=1 Tax=Anaerobacillus sp. CMMVII TaxID=2755588 RepID=UPI0021B719DE|nr:glutathionylspermidine synthase family protein [Anaerobacillus sp. CMMVII]MCT8138098.1 glutathionylspermidine synthase family protein [Anaerobacillus sp. CMMVII]